MKRHPKLKKLSEEHQNALVAAMALKGERTLPQKARMAFRTGQETGPVPSIRRRPPVPAL